MQSPYPLGIQGLFSVLQWHPGLRIRLRKVGIAGARNRWMCLGLGLGTIAGGFAANYAIDFFHLDSASRSGNVTGVHILLALVSWLLLPAGILIGMKIGDLVARASAIHDELEVDWASGRMAWQRSGQAGSTALGDILALQLRESTMLVQHGRSGTRVLYTYQIWLKTRSGDSLVCEMDPESDPDPVRSKLKPLCVQLAKLMHVDLVWSPA
jgi:hypothetical protein